MNSFNRTCIFLILLFGVIVSSYAQVINPQANKGESNKIIIASEPDYPPFCIVDKNGNADGFSVDLIKAVAKSVNIEVEIKIGIWNQIKQDLANGKIDALPLVGRTPERELLYAFTFPYLTLHGAIFVKEGTTGIKTVADLKEKKIVVMKGDNAEEYVRRANLSKHIFTTHTFGEAFRDLADGEYDAVITQRVLGLELLKDLNIQSVVPLDINLDEFQQNFCFAVKKGNEELVSKLNEGLSIVIANKTYDRLHLKWFGPNLEQQIALKDVIRIALYILLPLVVFFSVLSIIILRTEVKKRTAKLKESEEHFRSVAQSANDAIITADSTGMILDWNSGAEKIFGYPETEVINKDLSLIIPKVYLGKHVSGMKRIGEGGKPHVIGGTVELHGKRKNGNEFPLELSLAEWETSNGKFYTGIIRDITDRKKAEEEIKESEEKFRAIFEQAAVGVAL